MVFDMPMPPADPPMTRDQIRSTFQDLGTWRQGDEQAPHKPLMLLWLLARLQRGQTGPLSFRDLQDPLAGLLKQFGPTRKSYHPEYPFWHLRGDKIWQVQVDGPPLALRKGHNSPTKAALLRPDVSGHWSPAVQRLLVGDPALVSELGRTLLQGYFPPTLHEPIATAVGLSLDAPTRVLRDPAFRDKVLRAYEYRCGVCGAAVLLDGQTLGLEAAHVHWQARGGPCAVDNGIALCPTHHVFLDLGIWGLSPNREILVSSRASGGAVDADFLRFHRRPLREPQSGQPRVAPSHIAWHQEYVFKKPERAA